MQPDVVSLTLTIIDFLAVAVFAASGALAAVEKRMDIIGVLWLAAVTGIGGGTIRDLLLGLPVFWVRAPDYILVASAVAILVYILARLPSLGQTILVWMDAAGLAFVAVAGAGKALGAGAAPSIAILMGVITAAFGGIIRDILAHQPSILLSKEIYITAALVGAATFVGLMQAGIGSTGAMIAGIVAGFALRAGAILFGWRLPNARLRNE